MGVSFEGGQDKLGELIQRFERLGSEGLTYISRVMAGAALTHVQLGFENSRDPYGEPWAPVKRKGKPLLDTGRLRNSITKKANSKGFRLATNVKYAAIHQFGGTVQHGARFNAHGKNGRFISKAKAAKRKSAVRVSFSRAHEGTIKARPFLPDKRGMPPKLERELEQAANQALQIVFRGT